MVCINAYQEGVAGVFMKKGKVIAYESRKLKECEKRYSTYDLAITVVVHSLKVWRHYLLGKKFLLMTNHNSLTSYFKQPHLNA